jgi:outer membrane lipoprotein SlyB
MAWIYWNQVAVTTLIGPAMGNSRFHIEKPVIAPLHDFTNHLCMVSLPCMKLLIPLAVVPLLFASCAQPSLTGDSYSRSEAGRAQKVKMGKITSIRRVNIEGGTTAGTVVGGVAGGVLGNQIGSGRGKTLATLGGVGLGAIAGGHAQKGMQSRPGIEIQVRFDNGKSISITQEVNPNESFDVGDRVRVLSNGGRDRVTH